MNKKTREFRERKRGVMIKPNTRFKYKWNVSSNWFHFVKNNGVRVGNNTGEIGLKIIRNPSTSASENDPVVTKILALDCEMVSDMNNKSILARVSIVNYKLDCLYDKFVKPTVKVGDYRTRYSGIRERDLRRGDHFDVVQGEVKNLLRGKILVGHALHNDFDVLHYNHHEELVRDTAKYNKFLELYEWKTPSLRNLAKALLGEDIQGGEHNSIEDAKTAMKLYIKFRHEWEHSLMKKSDCFLK